MTVNEQRYCTVNEIAADPQFPFTVSALRYYLLHAEKLGLSSAIRKIGRKVLIRRDLFVKWLESGIWNGTK